MNSSFLNRRLAALLLLGALTCAARLRAQEMPTEVKPGAYINLGGAYSQYQIDYGKHVLGGVTAYSDVNVTERYGAEVEYRWLTLNQAANVHATSFLAGPRFSIMDIHGVTPYVKVLAGVAHFNFAYNSANGRYFVVAPGAGLDVRLPRRLTLRLIDFEYQDWPQFTYGDLHPYGVSIGLSYRIFNP
jgi:hypothetical protein